MVKHNTTNELTGSGTEVYFTFKLTDSVVVDVHWEFTGEATPAELEVEARKRLVEAGLPADLEEVPEF